MQWRGSSTLPPQLPQAAGYLWGFIDARMPGHRSIRIGSDTRTLPAALHRADDLASLVQALTGVASCTLDDGVYTITLASSATLGGGSTGRLLTLMGIAPRAQSASGQLPSGTTFVGTRVAPVAIPLLGAIWDETGVDADDVLDVSRRMVPAGYVWGGVRVWTLTLTMHRWALEALAEGWCTRGRVAVQCGGTTTPVDESTPGGMVVGTVLGVDEPKWLTASELIATVSMRIAVEPEE